MASTGAVAALQAALAAENAAIFGYGVAGAHLAGSSQATAGQDWTRHNQARGTLTAVIASRGAALLPAAVPGARRGQRDVARGLPRRRRDPRLPRPGRGQRPAAAALR